MHSPLYKKDKLSDDHVYTTRNQTKLKYDTKTKHFYDEVRHNQITKRNQRQTHRTSTICRL